MKNYFKIFIICLIPGILSFSCSPPDSGAVTKNYKVIAAAGLSPSETGTAVSISAMILENGTKSITDAIVTFQLNGGIPVRVSYYNVGIYIGDLNGNIPAPGDTITMNITIGSAASFTESLTLPGKPHITAPSGNCNADSGIDVVWDTIPTNTPEQIEIKIDARHTVANDPGVGYLASVAGTATSHTILANTLYAKIIDGISVSVTAKNTLTLSGADYAPGSCFVITNSSSISFNTNP